MPEDCIGPMDIWECWPDQREGIERRPLATRGGEMSRVPIWVGLRWVIKADTGGKRKGGVYWKHPSPLH